VKTRSYQSGKKSFQISFTYREKRFRVVLLKYCPGVRGHDKKAEALELKIRSEIALGEFDIERYSEHFKITKAMRQAFEIKSVDNLLFEDALASFLEDISRSLERTTYERYMKDSRAYLFPRLGHYKVTELMAEHFREMIRDLGHLTIKSIRNILTPARGTLEQMVDDGIIAFNPLNGVRLKYLTTKEQKKKPEPDPFTLSEIRQILRAAQSHSKRMFNLIRFGIHQGLRESELMGLTWDDVDFKAQTVTIRHAVVMRHHKGTKTAAGERTVNLTPAGLASLKAQRQFTGWKKQHVWCRVDNNAALTSYGQIGRPWRTILKHAGVRYRAPNQMRHTYASHMLSSGVPPIEVAAQLGHKDLNTLSVYARWVDEWKDEQAVRFGET
jgi:integrase